jgi:hypothetical protein
MLIEEQFGSSAVTVRQRWGNFFVIVLAVVMLMYGVNLRQQSLSSTTLYENTQAGISALYPANWLLDTSDRYILRVRDMTSAGFKTTIQLSILPINTEVSTRNLLDRLTLERSQTFTDYSVIDLRDVELQTFGNELQIAQNVLYTYVVRETSPFLEGIPSVVIGNDIIVLSGGQAIILTFRADRNNYDSDYYRFQNFLASVEF